MNFVKVTITLIILCVVYPFSPDAMTAWFLAMFIFIKMKMGDAMTRGVNLFVRFLINQLYRERFLKPIRTLFGSDFIILSNLSKNFG